MTVRISLPILIMTIFVVPLYCYYIVATILSPPVKVPGIEEWVEKIMSSSLMLERRTWRHISDVSSLRAKSHGKSS